MWALICLIGFIVLLFSASSSQRPRTKTSQEEQEAMLKRLKREDEMRRRMEYPEEGQRLAIWKNEDGFRELFSTLCQLPPLFVWFLRSISRTLRARWTLMASAAPPNNFTQPLGW